MCCSCSGVRSTIIEPWGVGWVEDRGVAQWEYGLGWVEVLDKLIFGSGNVQAVKCERLT